MTTDVSPSAHDATAALRRGFTKGVDAKEWREFVQTINRSSVKTLSIYVSALRDLTTDTDFLSSLCRLPSRACCLLRAIDRMIRFRKCNTDGKQLKSHFKQVMQRVDEFCKASSGDKSTKKSSRSVAQLAHLVGAWMSRAEGGGKGGQHPRRLSSSAENNDYLRQSDWSRLEELLRDQLAYLDKDDEIKAKVALVAQILLEEIGHRRMLLSRGKSLQDDACFTSVATTGLLVDWLQLLDPELLAHTPTLQRKLLFETTRCDLSTFAPKSFAFDQAYLLSLLVEHCDWPAIHNSIEWLLSDSTHDPTEMKAAGGHLTSVDPKTALDFLWVVIQAPKIWQGRENKNTNVRQPVLGLSVKQFCRLLSYVVAATVALQQRTASDPPATSYIHLISVYFSKFGQDSRDHVTQAIGFLRDKLASTTVTSPCAAVWWQLMAQLYVIKPDVAVWDEMVHSRRPSSEMSLCELDVDTFGDTITRVNVASNSHTDALVCSLLNRIGYVKSTATIHTQIGVGMEMASLESAYDANLQLIKLASSRPFLILRQLGLLCAMIRGRTRFDFNEFKAQHHLPLMLNLLAILKLLLPHLFRPIHAEHVDDVINVLWQMLKNYCHRARRQMMPLLLRTLTLTHQYLAARPHSALSVLAKHRSSFQSLARSYADHEHIMTWLTAIQSAVSSSTWANGATGDDVVAAGSESRAAHALRHPCMPPTPRLGYNFDHNLPVYMEMLDPCQDVENLLQVLSDFDESSKRKIEDLAAFVPRLEAVFRTTRDPTVRKQSFHALLRHVRTEPRDANRVLCPLYLAAIRGRLETANPASVRTDSSMMTSQQHSLPSHLDNFFRVLKTDSAATSRGADASSMTSPSSHQLATPHRRSGRGARLDAISGAITGDAASIARQMLQFLPDVVVLCRENARPLLGAAFDAGCAPAPAFSHPVAVDAGARRRDEELCDVLARAVWLMRGLSQSEAKPQP